MSSLQKGVIRYSLKVWLSAVLITPLLFLIFDWSTSRGAFEPSVLAVYPVLAILEALFSFLTWLFFYAATGLVVSNIANNIPRRSILSIMGLALTVATFAVFSPIVGGPFDSDMLPFLVPNGLCIVVATWYFKLPPNVE